MCGTAEELDFEGRWVYVFMSELVKRLMIRMQWIWKHDFSQFLGLTVNTLVNFLTINYIDYYLTNSSALLKDCKKAFGT